MRRTHCETLLCCCVSSWGFCFHSGLQPVVWICPSVYHTPVETARVTSRSWLSAIKLRRALIGRFCRDTVSLLCVGAWVWTGCVVLPRVRLAAQKHYTVPGARTAPPAVRAAAPPSAARSVVVPWSLGRPDWCGAAAWPSPAPPAYVGCWASFPVVTRRLCLPWRSVLGCLPVV